MVSVNANKVANTTSRCYNDQRANKNNRRVKENYQKKRKRDGSWALIITIALIKNLFFFHFIYLALEKIERKSTAERLKKKL